MIWKNIEKAIEFEQNSSIPLCKYSRELSASSLSEERKIELGILIKFETEELDQLIYDSGYNFQLIAVGDSWLIFYVPGHEYKYECDKEDTWYAPSHAYFKIDFHFYPIFIELLKLKKEQKD